MSLRRATVNVTAEESGRRLDHWLTERFTYHTRSQWQQAIRNGRLTVNANQVKPAYTLQTGDKVEYFLPKIVEPPVDTAFTLLHEDDTLLVVDKPGNLPCHPAGKYFRHTLWHLLRPQYGDDIHPVNRLDRETSGIVLVARDGATAGRLGEQFSQHRVRKEYLALVEGDFPPELNAVGWLGPDTSSAVHKKQLFRETPPDEANARSQFILVDKAGGLSLVRCIPHTGRLHQLRASLLGLGYPLVGDKLYGYDERCFLDFIAGDLTETQYCRLRMERQALHADRLDFTHPQTGQRMTMRAPMPADFSHCLLTHGFGGRYS